MRSLVSFFLLLLLTTSPVLAQVKDAGLWLITTAEYDISQKFSTEITEELRFNENVTELGKFFTDIGISYRFLKDFKTSFHYRFINERKRDDYYSQRHRWYLDVGYYLKKKPLELNIRTRYQSQYANYTSSADGKVPSSTWRNKIGLRIDPGKKWNPILSFELFTDMKRKLNEKVRFIAGVNYKPDLKHQFSLFYLHQRDLNQNNEQYEYIWGLGYSINLNSLLTPDP